MKENILQNYGVSTTGEPPAQTELLSVVTSKENTKWIEFEDRKTFVLQGFFC